MQLYRWQGKTRNFGDELNTLIWPRLLPDFFDDDPAEVFLGIGSILDARHAADAVKLAAGAGYGGYEPLPALDASWVIHWVRGPRTARLLGLPESRGLGDPAMLLPQAGWGGGTRGEPAAAPTPTLPRFAGEGALNSLSREAGEGWGGGMRLTRGAIGFMPHFESLGRGAWHAAASAAGVRLIDPRGDPAAIIAAIGSCRVLLSEALHGAIVADALRVPWIALRPLAPAHRAKWHDWAATLDLRVAFHHLAASSLPERLHASPLTSFRSGRRLLDRCSELLRCLAQGRFIDIAARALARAATAAPQLSGATALDRCQTRMLDRLDTLRRDPRRLA